MEKMKSLVKENAQLFNKPGMSSAFNLANTTLSYNTRQFSLGRNYVDDQPKNPNFNVNIDQVKNTNFYFGNGNGFQ